MAKMMVAPAGAWWVRSAGGRVPAAMPPLIAGTTPASGQPALSCAKDEPPSREPAPRGWHESSWDLLRGIEVSEASFADFRAAQRQRRPH